MIVNENMFHPQPNTTQGMRNGKGKGDRIRRPDTEETVEHK